MLNNSGESGHPCLIPDLRGNGFSFSPLRIMFQFSSVQSLSHVRLIATPWIAARQASLSITNSRSSLRLTSFESVMPSSHLILCRPLLLLPPIPPSIKVCSNESTLHMRWPKYWSFSFSIIPSKEHPELISFRMDWLDLLAVQGTLKSILQLHSSKASILRCWCFLSKAFSKKSFIVIWQTVFMFLMHKDMGNHGDVDHHLHSFPLFLTTLS